MEKINIYQSLEFNLQKPMIKVLFETEFTKEIRIAMHKNTTMKEHKTPFPIVLEIIDGKINFGVQENILILEKGDLVTLGGNVSHNLNATENSIIRLTLSKLDKTERVQNVVKP